MWPTSSLPYAGTLPVDLVAMVGRRMVLLHGFAKSNQKPPARELETAERRMAEYQADQREGDR